MSKGILAHYSPEDVIVSIGGIINIEGFSDGSFIRIIRDEPLFRSHQSSDGRISRVRLPSKLCTVYMSLMGTSEYNDVFTILSQIDHKTHIAKFPLHIKDSLGKSLLFSSSSWVEAFPEMSFSTSVTDREWVIKCANPSLRIAGNVENSSVSEDLTYSLLSLAPSVSRFL